MVSKSKKPNFKIGDHRVARNGKIQIFTGLQFEDLDSIPVTTLKWMQRLRRAVRRVLWIMLKPIFRLIKGVLNV